MLNGARGKAATWVGIALAILLCSAHAQENKKTDEDKPADPDTGESTVEEPTLGLLPQPFQRYGLKFAVTYIGEALGNPSGGARQGAVYEGRLNLAVDIDLHKLAGLDGTTFHANVFQIHGQGLSREFLQNFMVVSGIEALAATRLYEAYVERKWGSRMSIKVGQIAADSEFFNTKYTDVLTNASMGWPAITSLDLLSGGPSPPLAAVGARALVNFSDNISVLAGIFDGNQAGPGSNDPQQRNRYGLNFRINDPPLLLSQIQLAWHNKKGDPGLAGSLKLGAWQNFGVANDLHYDNSGVSLAYPSSTTTPALLRGNFGAWVVFEQKVYRVAHTDDRGIGVFARVSGSPSATSLIDAYADAGVEFIGLADKRPKDKFGIAVGYAHVSTNAQSLDRDFAVRNPGWPRRTFEGLITAAYQYQLRDGWTLQPNLQYIVRPGGGATDPLGLSPGKPLRNATVVGLRTTVKF